MYKRVVAGVAVALFSLLALVAGIVTDLHDRDFPQALGASSRLGLQFGDSELTDRQALQALVDLDRELGVGLVKIAPDLAGNGDERVFVALGDEELPSSFRWFSGEATGTVVDRDRLANSSADGSYLLTGNTAGLPELESRLREHGVQVTRTDASVGGSLRFAMGEGGFQVAVVATAALVAALALFWLSMKARSRALRVLGGAPAWRIQVQDLGGFAGVLLASAAVVALAGAGWVAAFRGPLYVGTFLKALAALELGIVAASLLAALALSALAWPKATALATRQPAVRTLRTPAVLIQVATFLLMVAAAGPAWSAYRTSSATAAETAQWRNLADQVAIRFGMSDEEMVAVEPQVGDLVQDAERSGDLAYSYTFTQEQWGGDLAGYSAVSFVNQRWLDLMAGDAPRSALAPVDLDGVDGMLTREFGETLTLLSRTGAPAGQILPGLDYLQPVAGFRLPVGEGGAGGLRFLDDVLVAVVPSVHDMFNDRNLTSMLSTRNVLFTGVDTTQQLLERNGLAADDLAGKGLQGELGVVYVAEEGILRAQFTAYVVWLMMLGLVALVVAFAVAAAIGALITALLHAKRDFPLRLSGRSWPQILQQRVLRQVLVGAGLAVVVTLLQGSDATVAVLAVATVGLALVPLCHFLAARWCFAGVARRRL